MSVFVQAKGSTIWHWRKDCSQYPPALTIHMITPQQPVDDDLCPECLEKEKLEISVK